MLDLLDLYRITKALVDIRVSVPFAIVYLIIIFGVYLLLRRYGKERFYRLSLVVVGIFWIIFGYIQLKHGVPHRIWAVIDAPYNYLALDQFFSYYHYFRYEHCC